MRPADRRARPPYGSRTLSIIVAACLATGVLLSHAPSSAAPEGALEPLATPAEGVTVDAGPLSVPSDGSFRIAVSVDVDEPTSYLEIRLQIRQPSGRLMIQRTEVRSDVETGTVDVQFARELADLELRPDAYPYEIRVRTQTDEVTERIASGFLLVHSPDPDVSPIALTVRTTTAPLFDAQGHFVTDPARSTGALEQAETIARAVLDDPTLRVTLAVAPVTLDEWARVAQGYLITESDEGLIAVGADEPGPVRYAAVLATIREALATGRLELLDIGYADPDVAALADTGRIEDLAAHHSRGMSTYVAALETQPSRGTAVAGDALTADALDVLSERDLGFALLAPEPLALDGGPIEGGCYSLEGSNVRGLVLDRAAADAIELDAASAGTLAAFRHAISSDWDQPIVTLTDLGPGRAGSARSVLELAGYLSEADWARLVTASEAAGVPTSRSLSRPDSLESTPAAPSGYWEEATEARRYAVALQEAAGPEDPESRSAADASLIAQSARWAGTDGRWSLADRGRAFASYAERVSRDVLDLVSVAAQDVTLAGSQGDVPISIVNGSTKELTVWLAVRGDGLELLTESEEVVTLSPQENFHTVGVDLRSALSGRLVFEVRTGEVTLASGTSVVRASYLDRLAIVGGVTVLLLGLLLYIRKRVRDADTATMPDGDVPESREDAGR